MCNRAYAIAPLRDANASTPAPSGRTSRSRC